MTAKSAKKSDKTVLISTLSGFISSAFAKAITHPIDTVKAIIQVNSKGSAGIFETFKTSIKKEGVASLYRGLPVAVLGSMPAGVLYFGSYEYAKKHLLIFDKLKSEFFTYFVSGMFAELVSCIIYVPVDVIKERRQVQSTLKTFNYTNDMDAFRTILKTERLRGLYKAYGATVMSFGPMSAFYFMFYEYFKGFFVRNDAKTYIQRVNKEEIDNLREIKLDISFRHSVLCSALAGSLSSILTNPLDLVKLRMQVQRGGGEKQTYKNLLHGLYYIGQNEGISAFGRGAIARAMYHTPVVAISMGLIEQIKPVLRKLLDDEI
jgi:hypothetical protein